MRILHIANEADNVGNGIVNVMVDLACAQQQAGHAVYVAAGTDGFAPLLKENGVTFLELDQRRHPLTILKATANLYKLIQSIRPDIVHAHMMTGALLARAVRPFSSFGLVTTVHNEFQRSAVLMGVGDRVIAVSRAVGSSMARRGVARQRIRVVSNGPLESARKKGTNAHGLVDLKKPAVLTVAGLYERKGIRELIEAFDKVAARFPAARLYIVGDGPDADVFKQLAAQSASGTRIHFEGFQPNPEDYMRSADIFVLASRQDPSPLVLPEARQAGAAIIATNVDGIPESLDDGAAGILVPPRDSDALADALTKLLENPETLDGWRAKSKRGLQRLSITRASNETLAVYREIARP